MRVCLTRLHWARPLSAYHAQAQASTRESTAHARKLLYSMFCFYLKHKINAICDHAS